MNKTTYYFHVYSFVHSSLFLGTIVITCSSFMGPCRIDVPKTKIQRSHCGVVFYTILCGMNEWTREEEERGIV